jgi:hypothetical protein
MTGRQDGFADLAEDLRIGGVDDHAAVMTNTDGRPPGVTALPVQSQL